MANKSGGFRSLTLKVLVAGLCVGVLYTQLARIAKWLTYTVMGMEKDAHLSTAVEFFIYEVPKVLLLLTVAVFIIGIIRSFFTPERTRRLLAGCKEGFANVLAALLGVVTPFCSCSAVPLFIGFVTAGIPLGVTFSFLIAAPMINEIALVLLFGLFGWKIAAIYAGTGLGIAIIAGFIIGKMKMHTHVEDWVYQIQMGDSQQQEPDWPGRIKFGTTAVKDIVGKVWLYVVIGIAVGAGIHGYVPEGFLAGLMGKSAWWALPVVVLMGVPMYSNAAGIIPIVQALLAKGAALGTVLAFMMAVIGLSLPEAIILRKVLKMKLLITFFGVVALGILIVGYIFNAII